MKRIKKENKMLILLTIDIDEESHEDFFICGEECMFRKVDLLDNFGKCLLFGEPLRYNIEKYSGKPIWHICEQCNQLCSNQKEKEERR